MIKPIQTYYKGYHFRSRLEARWAVFFDACKIKYEYEPQGFKCDDGAMYLPDFYLPESNTYVEVKANRPEAKADIERCAKMIKWGGPIQRILILSDVPSGEDHSGLWHFPCLFWDGKCDSVDCAWWFFSDYDDDAVKGHIGSLRYPRPFYLDDNGSLHTFSFRENIKSPLTELPLNILGVRDSVLMVHQAHLVNYYRGKVEDKPNFGENGIDSQMLFNSITLKAFTKARQARFEHGETP